MLCGDLNGKQIQKGGDGDIYIYIYTHIYTHTHTHTHTHIHTHIELIHFAVQ